MRLLSAILYRKVLVDKAFTGIQFFPSDAIRKLFQYGLIQCLPEERYEQLFDTAPVLYSIPRKRGSFFSSQSMK